MPGMFGNKDDSNTAAPKSVPIKEIAPPWAAFLQPAMMTPEPGQNGRLAQDLAAGGFGGGGTEAVRGTQLRKWLDSIFKASPTYNFGAPPKPPVTPPVPPKPPVTPPVVAPRKRRYYDYGGN